MRLIPVCTTDLGGLRTFRSGVHRRGHANSRSTLTSLFFTPCRTAPLSVAGQGYFAADRFRVAGGDSVVSSNQDVQAIP